MQITIYFYKDLEKWKFLSLPKQNMCWERGLFYLPFNTPPPLPLTFFAFQVKSSRSFCILSQYAHSEISRARRLYQIGGGGGEEKKIIWNSIKYISQKIFYDKS